MIVIISKEGTTTVLLTIIFMKVGGHAWRKRDQDRKEKEATTEVTGSVKFSLTRIKEFRAT